MYSTKFFKGGFFGILASDPTDNKSAERLVNRNDLYSTPTENWGKVCKDLDRLNSKSIAPSWHKNY